MYFLSQCCSWKKNVFSNIVSLIDCSHILFYLSPIRAVIIITTITLIIIRPAHLATYVTTWHSSFCCCCCCCFSSPNGFPTLFERIFRYSVSVNPFYMLMKIYATGRYSACLVIITTSVKPQSSTTLAFHKSQIESKKFHLFLCLSLSNLLSMSEWIYQFSVHYIFIQFILFDQ